MNHMPVENIMPLEYFGINPDTNFWEEMHWIHDLPRNTFFSLWLKIPPGQDLPLGHPLYLIAYLDEPVDVDWLAKQVANISQPIIVLNDGSLYDFQLPDNVYFYQYHSWHYHMDKIMSWFPERKSRDIKFKASAVCHRITQSKMLVFTALMEYLHQDELLVKLGDWLEEKNVHYRQPTHISELDRLSNIFFNKYLGTKITVDDFPVRENYQKINSDPWHPFYINSALHFTNESYQYSNRKSPLTSNSSPQVWSGGWSRNRRPATTQSQPGPCLSEKTYKCLISGTPFISVAQFDVYRSFETLGFKFDYGPLSLAWDQDTSDSSRLLKIIDLIKQLPHYSIGDIVDFTKHSSEYNMDRVWSGDFLKLCRARNEQTADSIIKKFK
jgi:hypothetical protein